MATLDEVFKIIGDRIAKADPSKPSSSPFIYKYVVINESGAVVRTCLMDLKNTMSLIQGNGEADCTFTLSEDYMIKVGTGQAKLVDGIAQGVVKFEGNQEAFTALQQVAAKISNK